MRKVLLGTLIFIIAPLLAMKESNGTQEDFYALLVNATKGKTALHDIVRLSKEELKKPLHHCDEIKAAHAAWLILSGARVDSVDQHGKTPLEYARRNMKSVRAVLQAGKDYQECNERVQNFSVYHSVDEKCKKAIQTLISYLPEPKSSFYQVNFER